MLDGKTATETMPVVRYDSNGKPVPPWPSPVKKKSKGNAIWIKTVKKKNPSRFAICIDNSYYPASLDVHKVYRVLPDADAEKDGDLRVIDESGEDYLYPADYFVLVELPNSTARALKKSYART